MVFSDEPFSLPRRVSVSVGHLFGIGVDGILIIIREPSVDDVLRLGLFFLGQCSPNPLSSEPFAVDLTRSLDSTYPTIFHGTGRLICAALTRACSTAGSAPAFLFELFDDLIQCGKHFGFFPLNALAAAAQIKTPLDIFLQMSHF